jgi:hypothetical protein
MSFKAITTFVALAIFAVVLYDFVSSYLKSTSTGFGRWIDAGRGSATMVVAQLGVLSGLLVAVSSQVTDWVCGLLNDPGAADAFKQVIQAWVTPTDVGIALALFAAVVAWARARTLKKA